MDISFNVSEDDAILILDALSAYRIMAESEMLSAFGDKHTVDECSRRMSEISAAASRIKKSYFESLKGA